MSSTPSRNGFGMWWNIASMKKARARPFDYTRLGSWKERIVPLGHTNEWIHLPMDFDADDYFGDWRLADDVQLLFHILI